MSNFVVGGSNSIFGNGWTSHIGAFTNLSVGANTTLCGTYRCLLDSGPKRGDTIIWEYGLNEIVHCRVLYDHRVVIRNLEEFLRLASFEGWKVLPLMLIPRREAREGLPAYYDEALRLFARYGLKVIEPNQVLHRSFDRVDENIYSDPVHYLRRDDITGIIGRMVADRLNDVAIPDASTCLQTTGTPELIEFPTGSVFENSIMSIPLARMPLRIRLSGRGAIRSLITLCRPGLLTGIRMRLTRGSEVVADARISTACKQDKTLLKAMNLDNVGDWSFEPGDVLAIRYIDLGGWLYAEQGLKKKVDPAIIPSVDTLAGVILARC